MEYSLAGSPVNRQLLVHCPHRGPASLALGLYQIGSLVEIHQFKTRKIIIVLPYHCIPFYREHYIEMCDKDWWRGLIVQTNTEEKLEVLDGKMVQSKAFCKLRLESPNKKERWVSINDLTFVGHVFTTVKPLTMSDLALFGRTGVQTK